MDIAVIAKPDAPILEESKIFYNNPDFVIVDEDYTVNAPCPERDYNTLVSDLKKFGPLVIQSKAAPGGFATAAKLKKNKARGEEVYGWKKGASPKYDAPKRDLLVVGAQKTEELAFVYFRVLQDTTGDAAQDPNSSLIRRYTISRDDPKLYVLYYDVFQGHLNMAHPVCPYGNWLFTVVPTADIAGGMKAQVHTIGQKIFEHYHTDTKAVGPNQKASWYARQATLRVWLATGLFGVDGEARKAGIKDAWKGVGDQFGNWDKEPYVRGKSSTFNQVATVQKLDEKGRVVMTENFY